MSRDLLPQFLSEVARRSWAWGVCDCFMVPADWVLRRWDRDPAAAWRGAYQTRHGALKILHRAGGVVAHAEACLGAVGGRRTAAPRRGDVAIVQTVVAEVGAICVTGELVAVRSRDGLTCAQFPILASWTFDG